MADPIVATYISANSFSVEDDQTSIFDVGRTTQMIGDSTWYGTIESSIYTTLTTVTLKSISDEIDSSLTGVNVSEISGTDASSAMPEHSHDSLQGSGGEIDHTTLSSIGTKSHSTIDSEIDNNISDISDNVDAIALNTTHRSSDGKDHSDVVLNNTHRTGNGSDHSDVAANTAKRHDELHTIVSHSDTSATGNELNTLTDGSTTSLHNHDGTYEPADPTILKEANVDDVAVNGATVAPISSNWAFDHKALPNEHHDELHTIVSHSDTTATGTNLNELTGGGDTTLHDHDGIDENTTHRSSDGTDHTYIDQDLRTTASPTFNKIQHTPQTSPTHIEGLVYYDSDKKALSYYNDESDVTVNMGQEVLIPVYNDSGDDITNGQIVYPSGVDATSGLVTIELADAHFKSKCRLVGMATHSIENGSSGYVTRIGSVGDVDTDGLSGILYLSATTPGAYTMTAPDDGAYVTAIGAVGKAHLTEGTIIVDPTISNLTVEITDQNGFPSDQRSGTTLSFSNSTPDRTLTITPTGDGFHFYQLGDKYEKTGAQSIQLDNTEGLHVIYYDNGVLTSVVNPTAGATAVVIMYKCIVAYIYWDATNLTYNYFADERHGISMSPETHNYLHFTRGAQYLSGLGLSDVIADGSGSLDTHAQFGIASGYTTDEDIMTIFSTITGTTGLPIYYLDGVSGYTRRTTNSGYSVTGAPVGLLYHNEWTGTTWQLTECSSGNFVLCHVFAVNGLTGQDQQVAVVGQLEYTVIADARAGASTEITAILSAFPFEEIVPIATIIFETKSSFTNTMKARVKSTDTGEDYVDWRTTELAQGATPSDHNNLTNLELAATGVTWGHINASTQSLYGVKTFDSSPIVPTPTSGTDAVNKDYADDWSPLTTEGDLITYEGGTTTRLPAGIDGQVLTNVDGTANVWATPVSGVTDHGLLSGLADDDHTQYHNDTRGDARYYTQTQVDTEISDHAALPDVHHDESHTIVSHSDTTATGLELDELTDGSDTSLHVHSSLYEPVDATILKESDVDDIAVDAATTAPISSNWAFDHNANSNAHHNELHTIASHSDTTATGANLNELVGGSSTALHNHNGTYEPADATILKEADVDDIPVNGATTDPVSSNWAFDHDADPDAHHTQTHTIASHSDTTATGANLNTLVGGGDTTLHDHDGIDENTSARHDESHTITSHSDIVDATGAQIEELTGGGDTTLHDHAGITENTAARHNESHTVASHSDTTATGAELNTLIGGGDTTLHDHDGIDENTSARHTRSHTLTSTSDHTATAYRTIYTDVSGNIQELAHGASTKVLTSNGPTADPSWETGASGGNVSTSGTPVDNDFAKFVNGTDIEGRSYSEVRGDLNVADGATANSSDATLLARANHTGTQAASTISDFDTEVSNNSSVTANTSKVTYPGSADATELNILDGATLTTTELNYVDGVTSSIQTQLNAKGDMDDLVDDTTPQLGGDLDLNDHYIQLDPTPDSDDTGSGDMASMTVDVNAVGVGAALHMHTDGNFELADADAAADLPCMALALETGTGTKKVLLKGFMRNDGWNWTSLGQPVYVSTTAGVLTQTKPTATGDFVQRVGIATHADRIFFNPDYTVIEIA